MDLISSDKSSKRHDKLFSGIVILQIISIAVWLVVVSGIIWVAWHFISKFW